MQVHDVDLRLLRIFVAIVECGGLSAAESRLNIGRSTISSHLSDLEVRLGIKLCKRGRSGFELTEPGRITYQASLELLQQCEAFATTVASSKDQLSGRVTIAVIDTMVSDPRCGVASAISALKAKSNNIQFDINVCEAREVETSVVNGRSLVGLGVSSTIYVVWTISLYITKPTICIVVSPIHFLIATLHKSTSCCKMRKLSPATICATKKHATMG